MSKSVRRACPECGDLVPAEPIDRRRFLQVAGGGAATLALAGVPAALAQESKTGNKTAEELIRELHAGLNDEQKKKVVAAYSDPRRLRLYNAALGGKDNIGACYTKPQQELVGRILRAISADEEGWRRISRDGTWDGSRNFENCGANIFGDPASGKYTFVFSGHHLTIRCDGNSEEGAAFGGPLYYGHSPNGYSPKNLFFYQTKSALAVMESMTEAQRKTAIVAGTPGEQLPSVRFRKPGEAKPGIAVGELNKDQQALVEKVMRDVLSPYRKEDAEEVMQVVKAQGGLDKVHMAFYKDDEATTVEPWHFWRLEGSGFVWNFRVLPHVHTFVNISSKV